MDLLSPNYLILLAIVVALFHAFPPRYRPAVLAVASVLLYALYNLAAACIFVASVAGVFALALLIHSSRSDVVRRVSFGFATGFLLVHLLLVKIILTSHGAGHTLQMLHFVGALGVSYYTFKLLGYLIDVYWRKYDAWTVFIDFVAFATFFPQLFAGPIQRANEFRVDYDNRERILLIRAGLGRMLLGYVKKLAVADQLGQVVSFIAVNQPAYSNVIWVMSYVYAIQLYADFSALTDIAIGAAALFGIKSPENFDFPFFASSISQFWRRWHMTLTRWLVDYVFTPLRMSTRNLGTFGLGLSITVNMVLIGLWHGLTIGCLLFGLINAAYLIVDTLTAQNRRRFYRTHPIVDSLTNIMGPLFVFHMVVFGLLLFRTESLHMAVYFVGHLLDGLSQPLTVLRHLMWGYGRFRSLIALIVIVTFGALETVLFMRCRGGLRFVPDLYSWPRPLRWSLYYLGAILAIALFHQSTSFIYVQF